MHVHTYICIRILKTIKTDNMKKLTLIAAVALSTMLVSFRPADKTTWSLDKAHAKLGFTITHMMVSDVEGFFKSFDAKITTSGADFTNAEVEMTAETGSINTDNEKRDAHLKSADFFDAAQFTTVTFKSSSFKKDGKNYKVKGNLTMHGVTKPVELTAICKTGTNPMSKKDVAGFKITGKVKRADFGIGGSMPGAVLSDEVEIIANAEFTKD
jgi:polyisoprenoid-binding protein YceI